VRGRLVPKSNSFCAPFTGAEKIEKETIDKDRIKLELRKMQATWFKLLQLFALLRDDRQDAETCKKLAELSNSLTDEEEDRGLKELFKAYGLDHS